MESCKHILGLAAIKKTTDYVCEECRKVGARWLHLRTCQTCGTTLCCDDSPNQHMTKHFHATQHPVITSAEPGERWIWCNEDQVFASY